MPTVVSVIVPIRNEERFIEATLRSLLDQDFPSGEFEVLVADGGSTDETVAIVRRLQVDYANLRLFFNPQRVSSAARNLAIRHMVGRYAVIVDGHCHIPDRQYLRNVVEAFGASGADTLGRPQPLDAPDPTSFQRAVAIARASRLGHNPESDIFSDEAKFVPPQSTAVAYRREVFHRVGLFDQRFDACEDVEFNHRVHAAGLTCYFSPKLKVVYHPRGSWKGLFIQLGRYGRGRARLAAKQSESLTLPALVPPLWVLWLLLAPAVCLVVPELGLLYLALLLLYAAVIGCGSLWLGRKLPWVVRRQVPLAYLGIHFGFAWGFWREVGSRCRARLGRITAV